MMNAITRNRNFFDFFSKSIFSLFFFFLLVEFVARLQNTPHGVPSLLIALSFFLITLFSSCWGIWIFISLIPLLNGLFLTQGWGDVSIAFSTVYFAWFLKQILKGRNLSYQTTTAFLADLLAVVVMLNLLLVMVRMVDGQIPSTSWFDWFASFPYTDQKSALWQINAASILLKGIFFYRIFELELRGRNLHVLFSKTFYIHTVVIVIFSIIQLMSLIINEDQESFGVHLPFNDIHSYGSYVTLLFVVFTFWFLDPFDKRSNYPSNEEAKGKATMPTGNGRQGFTFLLNQPFAGHTVHAFFACILFALCILSFSRMTWVVSGIFLLLLVSMMIRSKKILITVFGFIIFSLFIGSLNAPKLQESDYRVLRRTGSFFSVDTIGREKSQQIRYELWGRALKMVKDFPLAGVGLGNFYRYHKKYKSKKMGKWDQENAHNYYLQLMTELGIPGVILLLLIIYSLYFPGGSHFNDSFPESKRDSIRAYKFGLAAYLLTMFTGHPLLLANQQFLFWSIVALIAAEKREHSPQEEKILISEGFIKNTALLVSFFFLWGFCINIYKKGPWTIPAGYGLYSLEKWNGKNMRWMAQEARFYLPAGTKGVRLYVEAQPFNSQPPEGLNFTVKINDSVVDEVQFVNGGNALLHYNLRKFKAEDMKVQLEVDKIFCPRKIGLNNDTRKLGVALGLGRRDV